MSYKEITKLYIDFITGASMEVYYEEKYNQHWFGVENNYFMLINKVTDTLVTELGPDITNKIRKLLINEHLPKAKIIEIYDEQIKKFDNQQEEKFWKALAANEEGMNKYGQLTVWEYEYLESKLLSQKNQ